MPDRQTLARNLAETYAGGRYDDPWTAVETYRDYLDTKAENPDASAYKLAKELEEPRSKVRPWDNGSTPDPYRAIDIAEQQDWLDTDWGSDTTQALNCLVAWIFAGGSISEQYTPHFAIEDETAACAEHLLTVTTGRHPRRNERDGSRATELVPREDQSILGRTLVAWGAPLGEKHADRTDLQLPPYLRAAPEQIRVDFARTYVWNRGTQLDLDNWPVQITEFRSREYADEVRALFNSLVAGAVSSSEQTYRLSKTAADLLYRPPSLCE